MKMGVTINRPPRDGRMAFVKSPDGVSIELLNKGGALPPKSPGRACRTRDPGERPGHRGNAIYPLPRPAYGESPG